MANTIELKRILKSPVREIRMRGSVRVLPLDSQVVKG